MIKLRNLVARHASHPSDRFLDRGQVAYLFWGVGIESPVNRAGRRLGGFRAHLSERSQPLALDEMDLVSGKGGLVKALAQNTDLCGGGFAFRRDQKTYGARRSTR